ncbi:hypothetical protein AMS68_005630 [Peltaster fructicola]|uniref:PIN domain-containing protein n=1 Tax=Peltaster fructicola TaxID=286661 RepID=A0A6H0XZD0_9PEZI|nr:hypothetical protein AMS68_005630 [Peltaster fructicola]
MGVAKKTRKFATVKRVISQRDARLKKNQITNTGQEQKKKKDELIREVPQMPSNMFFQHNTALQAPYQILVDTNFLSHTVHYKLPLVPTFMDTLVVKHRIYLVATNDRDLKRRVRKVPGVPLISVAKGNERLSKRPGDLPTYYHRPPHSWFGFITRT